MATDYPPIVPLGPDDFDRILRELRPMIGRYAWIWKALRRRGQRIQGQLPLRLYQILSRFFSPNKPYFVFATAEGIRFVGDYRDAHSRACAVNPDNDRALLEFASREAAERGGDYLDVGANVGIHTVTVARALAGKGMVHAFEPAPDTVRRAAATFALNGVRNVRLYAAAVGDTCGHLRFFSAAGHSQCSSANAAHPGMEWTELQVPCTTLDRLTDERPFGTVGVVKVDVEGNELGVLAGASSLIARDHPALICEYNHLLAPALGWTADDLVRTIGGLGAYRFQYLEHDGSLAPFPPPGAADDIFDVFAGPIT